ncbi:MAG: thiol-activated cytolysin family protein [Byssovorax sp.]
MTKFSLAVPVLLAVFGIAACEVADDSTATGSSSGSGTSSSGGENVSAGHQAIDDFVEGIPDLVLPKAQSKTEIDCMDASCPKDGQEGDFFCHYKHYTETVHFEKFVAFQPNSATLWPGVVIRGKDAQEGLLTPLGVKLAPVVFSVSLENITNSPVGEMENPSLSAFRDARNEILAGGVTGATPASLDFDVVELHSESQLSTSLGAGLNWPGGPEIAASFDFSSSDKKTKILVNLTQAYYTIDVDSPTHPQDFFDPSVTVDDLKAEVGAGNPPLYVQSITFGRRVIFAVESNESATDIKAALEATYKGAVDVNAKVSAEHKQMLSSSSIRAFVIGGAGGEATGAISGFEGLITYIKNGGNYSKDSPGAPIAYKLAYLDNEVTKMAFTTEYSEKECNKTQGDLHAEMVSIKHVSGDDVGSNIELWGNVTLRYPVMKNGVLTCSSGGKVVDLWRLDEGSWITMPEYSTWKPDAPMAVDLNSIPMDDTQNICLHAEIIDEDFSTNELTADDDYGKLDQLIAYKNGWDGEHVLHLHGSGNNAVDVTVKLSFK